MSVAVYSINAAGAGLEDHAFRRTIQFVSELCHLQSEYKDSFFEIARAIEGLIVAECLKDIRNWNNTVS